ncbi:MAG: type II secretion system protein [Planctomycetota bacterium]
MAERRRDRARRGGFTLVELMAALLILSVVVSTVIGVFSAGIRTEQGAELLRDASRLALAVREQMLHDGGLGAAYEPLPPSVRGASHPDFPYLVYDLDYEAAADLGPEVIVVVTVRWQQRGEEMNEVFRYPASRGLPLTRRIQRSLDEAPARYEGR